MSEQGEFSLKSLFVPLTTIKAVHILLFVCFLVFFNTLLNGFVWDDLSNILYNPQVQSFNIAEIFNGSLINVGLQYRPVVTFYFSLMYLFFGEAPFFYHFVNILFHGVNSVLVLLLFNKFFSGKLSLFLALIFLVHPIQVESAAFIATSGNIYFLFGMFALLLGTKKTVSLRRGIAIGVLLFLSLLSKETGILFLGMIFVFRFLYKNNSFLQFIIIGSITSVAYYFLRFGMGENALSSHSDIIPIAQLSLTERLMHIPSVITFYLKTFFYPMELIVMQHWIISNFNFYNFYGPIIVIGVFLLLIFLTGIYLYKRDKKLLNPFLFFFVWYGAGTLLHIHLFPLNMTVADRWFYFPMVGLLGMLGVIGIIIVKRIKAKRMTDVLVVAGITIIILLSTRSMVRNSDWRDDLTLFLHDRKVLNNFVMENNIGWNYQHVADFKEANKYYASSVRMNPGWAISLNNLAYSYEVLGRKDLAKYYFYKVLTASDYHKDGYSRDLAFSSWALSQFESPQVAADFTKKALKIHPENAHLWAHLAIAQYALSQQGDAVASAQKAEDLSDDQVFTYLHRLIINGEEIPRKINIVN